jgi:hypothetical protein
MCTELYDSYQRALEISLNSTDERAQEHKRYRWRLYRAHASACGAQK